MCKILTLSNKDSTIGDITLKIRRPVDHYYLYLSSLKRQRMMAPTVPWNIKEQSLEKEGKANPLIVFVVSKFLAFVQIRGRCYPRVSSVIPILSN